MSLGFCSFFVITVLIIQIVTLFHAQNVAFTAKRKISSEFSNRHKTQGHTTIQFELFQIAIHFHPGYLQLKTLTDSLDTLI